MSLPTKTRSKESHKGGFFRFIINKEFEPFAEDLQLNMTKEDRYKYNCFTHAIWKATGDDILVESINRECYQTIISLDSIKLLSKKYNLHINIRKYSNKKKQEIMLMKDPEATITIGYYQKHWFVFKSLPISQFFFDHYETVKEYANKVNKPISNFFQIKSFKNNGTPMINKSKTMSSIKFLINIVEKHHYHQIVDINEVKKDMEADLSTLDYLPQNIKPIRECSNSNQKVSYSSIYFADFETYYNGQKEQPYCVSFCGETGDINWINGKNCVDNLVEQLPDNCLCYFHNLGFDGRFFLEHYRVIEYVPKGKIIYTLTISAKDKSEKGYKTIHFKDSYTLIPIALRKFPESFGLSFVKEAYPYEYHNKIVREGLYDKYNYFQESAALKYFTNDDDKQQFSANIRELKMTRYNKERDQYLFNVKEYAKFYCNQDVRLLRDGFRQFRNDFKKELNIDVTDYLSAPALTNAYFTREVYSKIPNLFFYSGKVSDFIRKAIYGGRCMTRDNKKWHIKEKMYDIDACSLYPSAMKRLLIPEGAPIVLSDSMLDLHYLLDHTMDEQQLEPTKEELDAQGRVICPSRFISAYIVEIEITSIGKERHFPLIIKKDPKTKTNRNVNELVTMTVDNIFLEDLVKFQGIEAKIKKGYYWTGKKNNAMSDVIQRLYDLRSHYKQQGSPLEYIFKLLLNSAYGKTIQKPIRSTTKVVNGAKWKKNEAGKWTLYDEAMTFYKNNKHRLRRIHTPYGDIEVDPWVINPINSSDNDKNGVPGTFKSLEQYSLKELIDRKVYFELEKEIDSFYGNNLVGCLILSMSKRIMNELICLAEDNDIDIYYQDTDSTHVKACQYDELCRLFKEKYGRDLNGKNLGQFHNDFTKIKGKEAFAIESLIISKKVYLDVLSNGEDDDIDYHMRCKGIPNDLLTKRANEDYDGNVVNLYQSLYDGEVFKFDLADCHVRYKMGKDTIYRLPTMIRTIQFK